MSGWSWALTTLQPWPRNLAPGLQLGPPSLAQPWWPVTSPGELSSSRSSPGSLAHLWVPGCSWRPGHFDSQWPCGSVKAGQVKGG